jgi:hypothetical protein
MPYYDYNQSAVSQSLANRKRSGPFEINYKQMSQPTIDINPDQLN